MDDLEAIVSNILLRVADGRMSARYASELLEVTLDDLPELMIEHGLEPIDLQKEALGQRVRQGL